MALNKIDLKVKYKSYEDDIINDFYNIVLSNSVKYDRAVGYFSSGALLAYVKGIKEFVKTKGTMRLIISPVLTTDDYNAITNNSNLNKVTEKMFNKFLNDEISLTSSQILYSLLKNRTLIIKIAEPLNETGIFHDKIGIFYDKDKSFVAISGSTNETLSALKYNTESFTVFKSWDLFGNVYAENHKEDFDRYWENKVENINFIDINDILPNEFLNKFQTDNTIDELYEKLSYKNEPPVKQQKTLLQFTPWPNQIQAKDLWFQNYKGILEMATGTGKTKTAIYIHETLKEEVNKLFTIVVVPDITLLNQWNRELIKYNFKILLAYSGNNKWQIKLKDMINLFKYKENQFFTVITTNDSFYSKKFQDELNRLNNEYFLLVDEMHNWGTQKIIDSLPKYKYILGLSATPDLHFKDDLNDKLHEYFGGIIFTYNLEKAIKDNVLVPYYYYPIVVSLEAKELENYDKLTLQIAKSIHSDEREEELFKNPKLQQLLFKRSRIIYGASEKTKVLTERIKNIEKKGRLVVYAGITSEKEIYMNKDTEALDNEVFLKQIDEVGQILTNNDIKFSRYTSKESEKERMSSIIDFTNDTYSTLLAIRCLDEGVDIPSIERAIILSSSTNPREFVQRRGRILRKSPDTNKQTAEIYDFIVLIPNDYNDYTSLNTNELSRYYEFARLSLNRIELEVDYKYLTSRYIRKVEENE